MQLEKILEELKDSTEITFDWETTSLHHKLMEIDGISFASDKLEATYIRYSKYDPIELREFILVAFSLPALYIGHNLQFDCKVLKHFYGIELDNMFDTMIASAYLDENRPKGLKELGKTLLSLPMKGYGEYVKESEAQRLQLATEMAISELGEDAKKKDIRARVKELELELPLDDSWLDEYGALDSEVTYKLYKLFRPLLEKEGLFDLFMELEMPYIQVLIDMTLEGISVDINLLKEMEVYLTEKKTSIEGQIYKLIGEFNIGSPMQLSEKLYGIKVSRVGGRVRLEDAREAGREYVKPNGFTATGAPSTDNAALEKLPSNEVVNLIREYRETAKLLDTYAIGYQKFVIDGKIYPNFNQVGTVSGRMSSSSPNCQQLPAERSGDFFIRDAFYAPEGYDLIVCDEGQLELRVMAHYSKDPELVNAFLSGQDIHTRTAQQILEREDISKQERRLFKTINFGIMYGLSAKRLGETVEITQKEAQEYLNRYFNLYGGVKPWMDSLVARMRKKGYITTLIGRKRRIPEIWSHDNKERMHAERQTINSAVQGSASDILKVAMLKIHQQFREDKLDAHMVLAIHDEIVVVCNKVDTEKSCAIIKRHMEKPFAVDLLVPLEANPVVVQTWGKAK